MKTNRLFFPLILLPALIFIGCVPSLHELYTKETTVYDPDMLGDWQQEDNTWHISGDPNDKSYNILIVEQDQKRGKLESRLTGHLVEIDGKRYLDLFPDKDVQLNVGNWFTGHLLRAHMFFKQEYKDKKLVLSAMDPEFMKKLAEENPNAVKHEETQDTIVLTASPYELQAFIKKYTQTKGFFADPMELEPVFADSAK